MKLLKYLWWPMALLLSAASWWGIAVWLEPRPLWTIPEGTRIWFSSYDPVQKRLSGYERLSDTHGNLVVIDAETGRWLAQQSVSTRDYRDGQSLTIDYGSRIANDKVWRFIHETQRGEDEAQLRCWPYATGKEEKIVARWPVPTRRGLAQLDPMREPISIV